MERSRLVLVIPAINEAATIGDVVRSASRYGRVVVVDDGSTDTTGDEAARAGAEVVRHARNRGYDEALNSGFVRAAAIGGEYVLTLDADGQHDPERIASFTDALDAGAHLVAGIRDRRQRFGESLFGWVAWLRWGIRDPLCGMKGYRLELWRELGHFDSYGSIGTELALFAAVTKRPVAQVAVPTRDRADAPRFGRRFSANRRILRALVLGMLRRHRRRFSSERSSNA